MNAQAMQLEKQRVAAIVAQIEKDAEYIGPSKGDYNYNYDTLKKIIVFIEDTGSGYEFFKSFFTICYPFANIELVKLGGHGNIKYIPNYKEYTNYDYDYTIIIYDRGRSSGRVINDNNRKDIPRTVKRLKKRNGNTKVFVFSPLCFESIPLSFSMLINVFLRNYNILQGPHIQLHNDMIALLSNNIEEINWMQYVISGKSIENVIEDAIETITKNTVYEISHSPSNVSACWTTNCSWQCVNLNNYCNVLNMANFNLVHKEKIELIAEHSALGGLTYIMDKIFGIKYRKYPLSISTNTIYKSKIIEEG